MVQRTWLITGVSSGFGRQLTEQLLERGDRVVGTVHDTSKVADLADRYPQQFRADVLDVTDTQAIYEVVHRSFAQVGRIDVIVSNAGYGLFGAAEELADGQVDHMVATNLVGSIQLIRSALPHHVPKVVAASSRSPPTGGRSRMRGTRCTTRRSGASRGSWSPSPRRSRRSGSA